MLSGLVLIGKTSTDLFLIVVGLSSKRESLAPVVGIGLWNYICTVTALIPHQNLQEIKLEQISL